MELADQDLDEDLDDRIFTPKPLGRPYKIEAIRETENVDYKERLATPLIQVFSVSISSTFDDGKPCELFGSIRVMEGTNPRFYLYDHDSNDPEIVGKQWNLPLIGADVGVLVPSLSTALDFCLKDKVRGVDVVKGKLDFDRVTENSYDTLLMGVVEGPHGIAYVHYVVFRFALYGIVKVTISKINNNDSKSNAADIYGTVVAGYENGRVYCADGDEDKLKYLETRLFDTRSDQPLAIIVGTPIRLSRNEVAVPTYSSLTIEVDLWDSNGRIASGCLKFPAHRLGDAVQCIQTQNACVNVWVRWRNAYCHLYNRPKLEDGRQLQKKPVVWQDQHSSASLVPSLPTKSRVASKYGRRKVEVFTVFVDGITENVSTLCGTILVDEGADRYSIYNRDENESEVLPDHKLARIEVNYRAIQNNEFYIILNLKDPIRMLEVSRGYLSWNVALLEANMLWYDKRLCSVVRGKDGYAAVHYEIFDNAFEAHLEVTLSAKGNAASPIGLYGTLTARYSGHDYSTSYQKKYFTSLLFESPKKKMVKVKENFIVEMVRSIVVVPSTSCLIIEANLGIVCINNIDKPVRGMTEFEIDTIAPTTKIIPGEDYSIEIIATFTR